MSNGSAPKDLEANYSGYFECFNAQLFFEAHEVLEELWLADRHSPNHAFYKGLIQFAGAFVHLQKHLENPAKFGHRLRPASALFRLARKNLQQYPDEHERLDVKKTLGLIQLWLEHLESENFQKNPLAFVTAPKLILQSP
jgi:predicted metal-dependent hydrolase